VTTEINALPAELNLRLYAGDTFSRSMQFTDSNGTGLDISTWTLAAQIRKSPSDDIVLKSFTINVTDAAEGEFDISLTSTEVDALEDGVLHHWDLQATVSTTVTTYIRGSVKVDTDVTRGA